MSDVAGIRICRMNARMFAREKFQMTAGRKLAIVAVAIALCTRGTAGEPPSAPDDAGRAKRLEAMKRSAAQFKVYPSGDRAHPFTLVESPIMRWTNHENLAKDGTLFLWTGGGRPQVILGLFTYDDDHYSHEWQSMAEGPLTAERDTDFEWSPAEGGVEFAPVKGAEEPAPGAAARLRQMKALAPKFSSTFVGFDENQNPQELRLLPQPLYRYEKGEGGPILDGALFAFVQGTDPQTLLALEARLEGATSRWHFAFVRMASGALTGRYENQEVYSVPKYSFQDRDRRKPYLLLMKQAVPDKE
jgi:hypothetical protein